MINLYYLYNFNINHIYEIEGESSSNYLSNIFNSIFRKKKSSKEHLGINHLILYFNPNK